MATGVLVVVGVASTAACSAAGDKTTTGPRTAAMIPADPTAALAAAQAKLGTENVRFKQDAGMSQLDFSGR